MVAFIRKSSSHGPWAFVALAASLFTTLAIVPTHAEGLGIYVAVFEPAGGEVFSGGSVHDIRWSTESNTGDPFPTATIEYLVQGVPTTIALGFEHPVGRLNSYPWDVPQRDLSDVRVRVCEEDFLQPAVCDTTSPFQIDFTSPDVVTWSPQGTDVPPLVDIVVRFTEPMNQASLQPSFSVSPPLQGLNVLGFTDGFRATHTGMELGVSYTATLSCGAKDRSDPGNSLAGCPFQWTFETNSTRPTVTWASPTGGERWSGGTDHELRWLATDAEDPPSDLRAYIDFTVNGSVWTAVAGPLLGNTSYVWAVPVLDAPSAGLRVRVVDSSGLEATSSSALFAIDNRSPTISGTDPPDGLTGVGWRDPVLVMFDEPVDTAASSETVSVRSVAGRYISGTVSWDTPQLVRFTPTVPYQAATRHLVRINATAKDLSDPGNSLGAPFESGFITLTNARPSIEFDMPFPQCLRVPPPFPANESDCALSGGSTVSLSWSATDPEDASTDLRVNLQFSSGGPFQGVAGSLGHAGTFDWTVPFLNTTQGTLRAIVRDSQNTVASDDFPFEGVDSASPTVTSTNPPQGATEVSPTAPVWVEFSEPVVGSFGLRRVGGAWIPLANLTVGPGPSSPTIVYLYDPPLAELAEYEIVVNGTDVHDASVPGNRLAVSSFFTFHTAALPPALALNGPAAGVRWSAGMIHEIILTLSDLHSPLLTLTADLTLSDNSTVELLRAQAGAGTNTFQLPIPLVDDPNAILHVCATDGAGAQDCKTASVGLDARAPTFTTTPGPDAVVHPSDPLVLRFSESMTVSEARLSILPSAPLTYRWTQSVFENDTLIIEHPRLEERRTYAAAFVCSLSDASLPGIPLAGDCPMSWRFTTAGAPGIRLLDPAPGQRLTGGVQHLVHLHSDDEEPSLTSQIDLSPDGGSTWINLRDFTVRANALTKAECILPPTDTANAFLRVTVADTFGLSAATTSGPFSIDTTPPTILHSTPADGSTDVDQLADLVVVFSESMSQALGVELSSSRPLGANVLESPRLTTTNVPFDTARIPHKGIRWGAAVELHLDARDASKPGNTLAAQVQFKITDDTERPFVRLAIDEEAEEGDVLLLDASDSSDNDEIVSYEWTIADDHGRILEELPGARAEYTADQAGLLRVSVQVVDAAGNAARESAEIEVHALGTVVTEFRYPPDPMLGWVALTGGASATAWSLTDRTRSFLSRVILLPLYVKMKGGDVLDNELRGMIRGYILVNPGDCYTDIKRNLQLQNGELTYHLSVLEREGIIKSVSKGAKRAYYPSDMQVVDDSLHEVQARILRHVAQVPGMSVHDLAGLVGASSQLTLYHMRKLGEMGYLRFERSGMKLRVFATDAQERARLARMAETG